MRTSPAAAAACRTLSVALEVLRAVHNEAERRDAGILFLGVHAPDAI